MVTYAFDGRDLECYEAKSYRNFASLNVKSFLKLEELLDLGKEIGNGIEAFVISDNSGDIL